MFRASNNKGFTIVELVVVIVVLGIISAVAAPKFFDLKGYEEIAFRDELVSALRFAQKRAVASGCDIRVVIDGTGYTIFRHPKHNPPLCGTAAPDIFLPDGNPKKAVKIKRPAGGNFENKLSPVELENKSVVFDALGRLRNSQTDPDLYKIIPTTHASIIDTQSPHIIDIKVWQQTGSVEVN
jgi:MSHA pilin protein MshC